MLNYKIVQKYNSSKKQVADDDIHIEEMKENPKKRKKHSNEQENFNDLDIDELKNRIKSFEPREIKDFIKRPFKTIFIVFRYLIQVFLLLLSGCLFVSVGIYKFFNNETYDHYLPYSVLGGLLMIPGVYYTFILINVWFGREGYDYELVPDLSE